MSWTDERVATLKKLWDEKYTADVIAERLGGVSRSAVLGLIHRKGWARHDRPPPKKPKTVAPPKPRTPRPAPLPRALRSAPICVAPARKVPAVAQQPASELSNEGVSSLKSLLERGHHECAYPVGTPDPIRGQLYCAAATAETYCPTHARKMSAGVPSPRKPLHSDPSWRGAPKRSGVGRRFAE